MGCIDLQNWVCKVVLETGGKNVFLSGEVCFCRIGSLGLGSFASNISSKVYETMLHLGTSHFSAAATEIPVERERKLVNGSS